MHEISLNFTKANLRDLLDRNLGATVVRPSIFPQHEILNEMLGELMELLPKFHSLEAPVLESNYTYLCLPPAEGVWARYAQSVARALNVELNDATDAFGPIEFDDLYLTRYAEAEKDGALGVGPHRDTNCKNLVAVLILKGQLPSFVCKEKDLSGSIGMPVEVGEILLMRSQSRTGLEKPLHYVGNIGRRSVIQFGMRQYISRLEK